MKQIAIRLPEDMIKAVDRIVEDRYGQADRSAVFRELVSQALEVRGVRK